MKQRYCQPKKYSHFSMGVSIRSMRRKMVSGLAKPGATSHPNDFMPPSFTKCLRRENLIMASLASLHNRDNDPSLIHRQKWSSFQLCAAQPHPAPSPATHNPNHQASPTSLRTHPTTPYKSGLWDLSHSTFPHSLPTCILSHIIASVRLLLLKLKEKLKSERDCLADQRRLDLVELSEFNS